MDVRDDARYTPARARLDAPLPTSAAAVEVSYIVTDPGEFETVRLSALLMGGRVTVLEDGMGHFRAAYWTGEHGIEFRVIGPTTTAVEEERILAAADACPRCHGTGKVADERDAHGYVCAWAGCGECGGTGRRG